MIKVGITGAHTSDSGELIRILAMHPDVEIVWAVAPGFEGKPLTSVHHGLIGETTLCFTASGDVSQCDVLFICTPVSNSELARVRATKPDMRIIMLEVPADMECAPFEFDDAQEEVDPQHEGVVYGLPEINRKPLVRGARVASVPEPFASMALVALYPFASHLLLNSDIRIEISAPEAIIDSTDIGRVRSQVVEQLTGVQKSFAGNVEITTTPSEARRSTLMNISFGCALNLQQMLDLYVVYDDHRFSFVTTSPVGVSEVAGTNKCVITVAKSDPEHSALGVAADCRLRGGAGEAVHIMNLMCGLHEKTGLNLKAIDFEKIV